MTSMTLGEFRELAWRLMRPVNGGALPDGVTLAFEDGSFVLEGDLFGHLSRFGRPPFRRLRRNALAQGLQRALVDLQESLAQVGYPDWPSPGAVAVVAVGADQILTAEYQVEGMTFLKLGSVDLDAR